MFVTETKGGPNDGRRAHSETVWWALPLWWAVYWPMVLAARCRIVFVGDAVTLCLKWAKVLRRLGMVREVR